MIPGKVLPKLYSFLIMFLLPPRNIQQVGKLALYLDASCDNPSPQEHVYRYCHQDCGVGNQSSGCLSSNRWHDGFNEFCFRDDEWDVFADIWKPGDQWRFVTKCW